MLYFKHWLENVLLVNLGALAAVLVVAFLHSSNFGTLGLPGEVSSSTGANPYTSTAIGSIFLWINIGALLSSLPVAAGLRQPVGKLLN